MSVFHVIKQDTFDAIAEGREPKPENFNPFIVSDEVWEFWAAGAQRSDGSDKEQAE